MKKASSNAVRRQLLDPDLEHEQCFDDQADANHYNVPQPMFTQTRFSSSNSRQWHHHQSTDFQEGLTFTASSSNEGHGSIHRDPFAPSHQQSPIRPSPTVARAQLLRNFIHSSPAPYYNDDDRGKLQKGGPPSEERDNSELKTTKEQRGPQFTYSPIRTTQQVQADMNLEKELQRTRIEEEKETEVGIKKGENNKTPPPQHQNIAKEIVKQVIQQAEHQQCHQNYNERIREVHHPSTSPLAHPQEQWRNPSNNEKAPTANSKTTMSSLSSHLYSPPTSAGTSRILAADQRMAYLHQKREELEKKFFYFQHTTGPVKNAAAAPSSPLREEKLFSKEEENQKTEAEVGEEEEEGKKWVINRGSHSPHSLSQLEGHKRQGEEPVTGSDHHGGVIHVFHAPSLVENESPRHEAVRQSDNNYHRRIVFERTTNENGKLEVEEEYSMTTPARRREVNMKPPLPSSSPYAGIECFDDDDEEEDTILPSPIAIRSPQAHRQDEEEQGDYRQPADHGEKMPGGYEDLDAEGFVMQEGKKTKQQEAGGTVFVDDDNDLSWSVQRTKHHLSLDVHPLRESDLLLPQGTNSATHLPLSPLPPPPLFNSPATVPENFSPPMELMVMPDGDGGFSPSGNFQQQLVSRLERPTNDLEFPSNSLQDRLLLLHKTSNLALRSELRKGREVRAKLNGWNNGMDAVQQAKKFAELQILIEQRQKKFHEEQERHMMALRMDEVHQREKIVLGLKFGVIQVKLDSFMEEEASQRVNLVVKVEREEFQKMKNGMQQQYEVAIHFGKLKVEENRERIELYRLARDAINGDVNLLLKERWDIKFRLLIWEEQEQRFQLTESQQEIVFRDLLRSHSEEKKEAEVATNIRVQREFFSRQKTELCVEESLEREQNILKVEKSQYEEFVKRYKVETDALVLKIQKEEKEAFMFQERKSMWDRCLREFESKVFHEEAASWEKLQVSEMDEGKFAQRLTLEHQEQTKRGEIQKSSEEKISVEVKSLFEKEFVIAKEKQQKRMEEQLSEFQRLQKKDRKKFEDEEENEMRNLILADEFKGWREIEKTRTKTLSAISTASGVMKLKIERLQFREVEDGQRKKILDDENFQRKELSQGIKELLWRVQLFAENRNGREKINWEESEGWKRITLEYKGSYEKAIKAASLRQMDEADRKALDALKDCALKEGHPFVGFSLAEKVMPVPREAKPLKRPAELSGKYASSKSLKEAAMESEASADAPPPPLVVDALYIDGPAHLQGIYLHDILISIAGVPVTHLESVHDILKKHAKVGSEVEFTLKRPIEPASRSASPHGNNSSFGKLLPQPPDVPSLSATLTSLQLENEQPQPIIEVDCASDGGVGGRQASLSATLNSAYGGAVSISDNKSEEDDEDVGSSCDGGRRSPSASSPKIYVPYTCRVPVLTVQKKYKALIGLYFDIDTHERICRPPPPGVYSSVNRNPKGRILTSTGGSSDGGFERLSSKATTASSSTGGNKVNLGGIEKKKTGATTQLLAKTTRTPAKGTSTTTITTSSGQKTSSLQSHMTTAGLGRTTSSSSVLEKAREATRQLQSALENKVGKSPASAKKTPSKRNVG